jgi:outer membrane protein TolC
MKQGMNMGSGDVVRAWFTSLVMVFAMLAALPVSAQQAATRALTLADALRMAEQSSENVAIARAGVLRSGGQLKQARSEFFPQISGSLGYTRTLASEFSSLGSDAPADTTMASEACGSFTPNPSLPLQSRVDSLEAALRCKSEENPFAAFRDLPFGRENAWQLNLSVSQTVFSGGRVSAQSSIAGSGRRIAEMNLTSSRAQVVLDVASAYYDAALADQLYRVAQETLDQAETTLRQVRLGREVGNQPEFELLRAQVTRDTQEPLVIQRRSDRDIAQLRLKQLLDLPQDATLQLATELDGQDAASMVSLALDIVGVEADTSVEMRMPVRQASETVQIQESQRAIARANRLPSLTVNMQYGRVGYPSGVSPFNSDFRTNWTVGASIQLPIFTGFRLSGAAMVAQADLDEAHARLEMTRELTALDSRDAAERLASAQASWNASSGTVEQANRAYEIAQVRFDEGISTQLELNDSRITLQQAQINRAQAARNLHIARLRLALLPWLPLGGSAGSAATQASNALQSQQQPPVVNPSQRAGQQSVAAQNTGTGSAIRN